MENCPSLSGTHFLRALICFFILLHFSAAGQNQLGQIQEQFTRYQENALQEKIFVHTSKDNFFSGETMFFKVYAVDGMLHKPLSLSSVAYVEMINSKNQPAVQIKIALKDGVGNGSLVIPDSLSTGYYRLIAYTAWMRNFSPEYFFAKNISIVSPLRAAKTKAAEDSRIIVKFFPEGGNLVNGLASKVAFQATDASGQSVDFKGVIIDEKNDTITKFKPLKFGIGNFSLTPQKGKSYRAFIQTKDGLTTSELPVSFDEGYVLSLTSAEANITINVKSNKGTAVRSEVYLFIHNRQRVRKAVSATLDDSGAAVVTIPMAEMEEGISHITLFDRQLNPIAERLFFKQPEQLLMINADLGKKDYSNRERVDLTLSTQKSGKPAAANLSMSIFKVDDIQGYDSVSMVSYLLLTSDLKGSVENPFYYLTPGNGKNQAVDNLMLTHGWSRFNWADVMKKNWPIIQFSPENEGMIVRAAITNEQESPKTNASVFLSTASTGQEIKFYPARSNTRGQLQFYTSNLYGRDEIIFQQAGDSSKFNINIVSPFTDKYPSRVTASLKMSRSQEQLIRSYSIHNQVQKAFNTPTLAPFASDSVPFFGKPDKSYLLSDYVSFPQLMDVLKEYVFEVIVRKHQGKFHVFTMDKTTQTFFEIEPFVLLDGVPVFDTHRIVTMPARDIKRLDLINRKFYHGQFVFNGIISLTSHGNSEFSGVQLNPEAVVFDFEGLQQTQEFYSPAYNDTKSLEGRFPDFRNVLVWTPEINTDATGKSTVTFSTSDLRGKYVGVINGLTKDGLPGSTTFVINVD